MVTSPHYQVRVPLFEGPLSLLLSLIEREELDITTISLAQVTDQYLTHLADLQQERAGELSGFLVVAAKLLLIKSLALLPRPPELPSEANEVGDELVQQLRIYKRFKEITALLRERETQRLHSYVRIAPLPHFKPQLDLSNVTAGDLLLAVQQALDAIPAPPVGEVVSPITVTIDGQMACIEDHLGRHSLVRFREILSKASTTIETIVTLQALLVLIKQDRVWIRQEQLFGEIVIGLQPLDQTVPAEIAAVHLEA